jgi:lipopolysaccharide/colanic/teichoic acid biosynthesis glycosyltransferase
MTTECSGPLGHAQLPPESVWPPISSFPERPSSPRYDVLRRAFDLTVVAVLAIPAALVVAVCAVALRIESPRAPTFYRQWRTGHRTERFLIIKLRTMVPDADARKAELRRHNLRTGPDFKVLDDPRVTRVGRVLRRLSLDELPQLVNVARGEMTLIGPRPTSLDVDSYEPWQLERFDLPPGLTGLWQAEARASESWDDRIALDIAYVRRRSLRLDWRILRSTVRTVVQGEGST